MTTPEPNPFAEEIEADYHQALLESGNLPNLKSGSHKWTGKNCWIAEGFLGKYLVQTCACKKKTIFLAGIFILESNEAKKASRFTPYPKDQPLPKPGEVPFPVELAYEEIPVCPYCLPQYGFPDVYSLPNPF
jgi:hypothetical protein